MPVSSLRWECGARWRWKWNARRRAPGAGPSRWNRGLSLVRDSRQGEAPPSTACQPGAGERCSLSIWRTVSTGFQGSDRPAIQAAGSTYQYLHGEDAAGRGRDHPRHAPRGRRGRSASGLSGSRRCRPGPGGCPLCESCFILLRRECQKTASKEFPRQIRRAFEAGRCGPERRAPARAGALYPWGPESGFRSERRPRTGSSAESGSSPRPSACRSPGHSSSSRRFRARPAPGWS